MVFFASSVVWSCRALNSVLTRTSLPVPLWRRLVTMVVARGDKSGPGGILARILARGVSLFFCGLRDDADEVQ